MQSTYEPKNSSLRCQGYGFDIHNRMRRKFSFQNHIELKE